MNHATLFVIRSLIIGWRERTRISAMIVARVDIHDPKDANRGRRVTGRFGNMQRWGGRGEEITLTCGQRESSRAPRGFQQVSKPYSRFSPKSIVVCEIRSTSRHTVFSVASLIWRRSDSQMPLCERLMQLRARKASGVRDRVCPRSLINKTEDTTPFLLRSSARSRSVRNKGAWTV